MSNVESMMYVGETPFHWIGTRVAPGADSETAIRASEMDWRAETVPLYSAEGYKAQTQLVRRCTDGRILGEVGPRYEILQPLDAFTFCDGFVASGQVSYETAGSLNGGSRIWILAKLNKDPSVIVPRSDDVVNKYLLLSNSYDGSEAVRVGFTPIRVVCSNTLAMAHRDGAFLKVKHTASLHVNLEGVRASMERANDDFERTAALYRVLASKDVTAQNLREFVLEVFAPGASAKSKKLEEKATKRAQELAKAGIIALGPVGGFIDDEETKSRILPQVTRLFESGRGNNLAGVRGTWWAAYNAVTEYLQYERRGDLESRMDSLVFGAGANQSKRALDIALRMAA